MKGYRLLIAGLIFGTVACDTSVEIRGRTFGTRVPALAGMTAVAGDLALELAANDDVWPLEGVSLGSEFGGTSNAQGSFQASWRGETLGVTPLTTNLRFAKAGFRTEERTFWLTDLASGRVLVILFANE